LEQSYPDRLKLPDLLDISCLLQNQDYDG